MLLNCGVGEDSWESLGLKEIQPVHLKGNQSWIFIGRTDAEADVNTLILWSPDAKSQLTGYNHDARKDWRQKEKGTTEDEMVGWHHWLNGYVWISSGSWWWTGRPGVLQSMGSQSRMQLNWTELMQGIWGGTQPPFSANFWLCAFFYFSVFSIISWMSLHYFDS